MRAVTPTVVVIGAGFSGTMTAVHLLREAPGPLRVTLVERSGRFGPGVAYATPDERHLLNVAAERMSAFDDAPDHLIAWARRTGLDAGPGDFLSRARYGAYLRDVLADAERAAPPGRVLERVVGEAVDVVREPAGAAVVLADGRRLGADHVVLALGHLPGVPPVALPDDPRVVADPWAPGALAAPSPDATALLIGTGLTAVDVVLSHCARAARGRVVAISRSGCLPYAQPGGVRAPVPAPPLPPAPTTVERLERWLRVHVARSRRAGHDWRDVVDGVRFHVPELWRSLPVDERRRFLAERSRAWEVRRHRMAPQVAARIDALRRDGRLLLRAGRILAVRALPRTVEVLVDGGGDGVRTLRADRVVVCAGPGADVRRARVPLLDALLDRGLASPDPLGLGLRACDDGALVGADGRPRPWLRVLGPLRRGELWETTAVGELRVQAQRVARAILGQMRAAARDADRPLA